MEIYYLPLYSREVWHYDDANTELIRRTITQFHREGVFLKTNVNEKVDIFNSFIMGSHIKTSPLTCRGSQWIGFYMIGTTIMKELTELISVY